MTRFEKVITEKREELKKILINCQCPSEFGIENPKYCDISNALTWDCETCWNEEMGKEAGGSETIKQEGGEVMIQVGQVVSWQSQGGGHRKLKKGIVRAIVEPGENLLGKCPEILFTPISRSRFRNVSRRRRVLIEVPKDGRGGRHYSDFYAPPMSAVEKNIKRGEQIDNQNRKYTG